jgi:hypothetical protein
MKEMISEFIANFVYCFVLISMFQNVITFYNGDDDDDDKYSRNSQNN